MSSKVKIGILITIALLALSLKFDAEIIQFIEKTRISLMDELMLFLTNGGLFVVTSAISAYLILTKKYKEFVLVTLAGILSLESAYLLKKIIQIPRPYLEGGAITNPLIYASGFAFPSLHAAFSLSVIPFLKRIFKSKILIWSTAAIFILITISRIYLGVHYLSDIIFGGLIGFMIAYSLIHFENKYQLYEKLIYNLKDKLELRRQIAHLITGLFIILLIKLKLINAAILLGILIIGGVVSLVSRKRKIPFIYPILRFFDRPIEIKTFPGKGSFYLVLGSFLSLMLFEERIALAAISIMAVGDSVSTLVGLYIGKYRNFINPFKHLEGTVLAIIFSTIAAFTFVSFEKALLAATGGMIFEALTIRKIDRYVDDNVLIPLVAGFIMTAV